MKAALKPKKCRLGRDQGTCTNISNWTTVSFIIMVNDYLEASSPSCDLCHGIRHHGIIYSTTHAVHITV